MKAKGWWTGVSVAGLGMLLASLTGCQTWEAGMTLPSGRYLQHPPQYFPSEPVFPLENEQARMDAMYAQGVPGGPGGPLPRPVAPPVGVPPVVVPGPAPAPLPAPIPGPLP